MSNYVSVQAAGWIQGLANGIPTFYLSLAEEGITTGPTDTPANVQYQPAILDIADFGIARSPAAWYEGNSTGAQAASYGTIKIYNQNRVWDFMLQYDLQDTRIVVQLPDARALTTGTQMRDALTILTGIMDQPKEDDQGIITIAIRDSLTRLDKALPVRFIPGFRDSGAAGAMVPLTFGAFRNRAGILVDAANRLYLLHDGPIPNIVKVADMAAPLDPHAAPPQYTPALNGYGVQLQTLPVGKLTFDGSSYGTQSTIPGVDDVYAGDGHFLGTWTGSPAVPPGWTWSHGAGSSIGKLTNPPYAYLGTNNGVRLLSAKVWNPATGNYSDQFYDNRVFLLGGSTYRINFSLANVQSESPYFVGGMQGGLILTTKLSNNAADYITGINSPIVASGFSPQTMSFEFTVPKGVARPLYFIVAPSSGNAPSNPQGVTSLELGNVTLELVGQYVDQPLTPLPFGDYVRNILVDRAGEDASIFNSAEAYSVFKRADGTLKPWGICFDTPPNIVQDCLMKPAKSDGYVVFTDSLDVIRFRRQLDPRDPANQTNVKCDFTSFNMSRPVIDDDVADALTTLLGSRANQSPFTDADFVSDTAIVGADTRTRFKRKSQFFSRSNYMPFAQYAGAVNAPIFDTVFDEQTDASAEGNRVVGMFSPRRYSSSVVSTQKRQRLTFVATFDDPYALGINTKCAVPDLLYGDIVYINYQELDGGGRVLRSLQCYGSIVKTTPYYFRNQINLVARI